MDSPERASESGFCYGTRAKREPAETHAFSNLLADVIGHSER